MRASSVSSAARFCLLVGVLLGGWSHVGRGQDVALSSRAPRFLWTSAPGRAPVEVSADNNAQLRRIVSLTVDRPTIGSLLAAIEQQTGLRFGFSRDVLPAERPVALRADRITVGAALLSILMDTGVDVILSPGGKMALVARNASTSRRTQRQGGLTGRVTDEKTGERVASAEVFLEGTRWRTSTDAGGRYLLAEVDTGHYQLAVRRLGYSKQTRPVVVRDGQTDTVNVALAAVAARLEELVTTATGQRRRLDIANDVTTINADSVMQTAPIRSLTDLLESRVPGLTVQRTSGAPGDPARLRLRGTSSVTRNNDPIVFIDGIRAYSEQSAARNVNLAHTAADPDGRDAPGATPSPLDYLDPNMIETIEVLKGPEAATLYGPDGANGVIVVTTKRGRPGPARWTASVDHARTAMVGSYPELLVRWGHELLNNRIVNCPVSNSNGAYCVGDSIVAFQALNDPDLTVLDKGRRTGGALSVSGGTQTLTYLVTGSYADEVGLIKLPAYEVDRFRREWGVAPPDWMQRPQHFTQWAVTSNLQTRLGAKGTATFFSTLSRTEQQKSTVQSRLDVIMTTYLDRASGRYYQFPTNLVDGGDAFSQTPLKNYATRVTAGATQFANGANLEYRPWNWLSFSATGGLQVVQRVDQIFVPRGFQSDAFIDTTGQVNDGQGRSVMSTVTLRANANQPLGRGFQFRFALGVDYTGQSTNDIATGTTDLAPGSSLQGSRIDFLRRSEQSDATFGWYAEPSIGNNKLNFSTGLRLASGSSFGANVDGFNLPKFPKLGVSYLVSDESWFPLSNLVQSLRVRVAYGPSSRQPGPGDKLRLYGTPTQVFADGQSQTGVLLTRLGNTELRPERTTGLEGGFDADLFDSRLNLSVSGYRKTTTDALMEVPVAPEIYGEGVTIVKNIGVTRNTGLEMTAGAQVLRGGPVRWSTQVTLSQNRNVLVKLGTGVAPFYSYAAKGIVGEGSGSGLRNVPGYPLNGRWARPILGYADANGNNAIEPEEVQLGDTAVYLGPTVPDYTATFSTTLSLWHGAVKVNANFARDGGVAQRNEPALGLSRFSAGRQVPGTPLDEQVRTIDLTTGFVNVTDYNWVQTASTTRFNSLSVSYTVPPVLAQRLGAENLSIAVRGGNLKVWTNYNGIDPNVNAYGTGNNVSDTGVLPQSRTWQLRIDATF